jgi:hypothetical protein
LCYPYLYYADVAGFGIVDVSDPTRPTQVAYVSYQYPNADCWGLDVQAGLAYVGVGESGMKVYDVSNPLAPWELGFYDTADWTYHVCHHGGRSYVADYNGFCVLEYYGPSPGLRDTIAPRKPTAATLRVLPSLAGRKVTVEFTVPGPCTVTVRLCDALGRKVRTLLDGTVEHCLNQLDVKTEDLPAGTYFVVLESGGKTQRALFVVP